MTEQQTDPSTAAEPVKPRRRVVVDVETNGLDLERHQAVEVAWHDLETGESASFIPLHDVSAVLAKADIRALQVNRYVDRIANAVQGTWDDVLQLWHRLDGVTIVGANPRFDMAMLTRLFRVSQGNARAVCASRPEPWHHRPWDVEVYAAAVLHLDDVPGLARVCEKLGIQKGDHSAADDVRAAVACLRDLEVRAAAQDPDLLAARDLRIRQLEADRAPEVRRTAKAVAAAWRNCSRTQPMDAPLVESLEALLQAVNRHEIGRIAPVDIAVRAS